MKNIALEWDPYNNILTVRNDVVVDGTQFEGESEKPVFSFDFDSLVFRDNFEGNQNYYTDQGNHKHPFTEHQVEEIRTYASYFDASGHNPR